jgi:aryl-alcohol dehydrogenase-like predicted oxidoreductase
MQPRSRRGFMAGLVAAAAAYACRNQPWAGKAQSEAPRPESEGTSAPDDATNPVEVPTRRLGRTGVQVSALGLGGFHIGQKLSERESINLIRRAIDNGITFLDNCWDYNDGDSEIRMGKALAEGYRQRAFLMTKIDGRTRKAAAEQLDQSLRRLSTDQIDLVQIHEVIRDTDPARCFGPDGTMEALTEARAAGKLRFIGFTGHKDPKFHLQMLETARQHNFIFDTVQMPLNLMDAHFRSFGSEVLPVLLANDIGVIGMKSMGSGDILKSGVVTAEECLRYALSLPASTVVCGMDSVEVFEENLKVARSFKALSKDAVDALVARTAAAGKQGEYEQFKTSQKFDGTERNPHWLEEARL